MEFFASCAPGVEPLLHDEVERLGVADAEIQPGGVRFSGDCDVLYRANLELGLALHILVRIGEFRARHFGELVRKAERLPWPEFIQAGQALRLHVTARHSKLLHTKAIEERIRAAIASSVPSTGATEEAPIDVYVRIVDDIATLSIDSSGEPLYRRGYRGGTGKAPLRPDLARALVILSGWQPGTLLVDPMMGSGTIAIEAALLGLKQAPGSRRSFAFQCFPSFDRDRWDRIRSEACRPSAQPVQVLGRDRDRGVVRNAIENAARAGVADSVDFAAAPISELLERESWPEDGAVVTNPPHGRRVGRRGKLAPLYQTLGKLIAALPERWKFALVVGDRRLAHATGVPLKTSLLTNSGGLRMRMMTRT